MRHFREFMYDKQHFNFKYKTQNPQSNFVKFLHNTSNHWFLCLKYQRIPSGFVHVISIIPKVQKSNVPFQCQAIHITPT